MGHITEDPGLRNAMMEKRFAKLDLAAQEIPQDVKLKYFGPKDAGTVIVSWGSTKGALLDALDRLWAEGAKIGYLHVRLINPFPSTEVLAFLAKARRRIAVEMNFGAQLASVVREHTGVAMTHFILKYNGRPMSNTELYEALRSLCGRGEAGESAAQGPLPERRRRRPRDRWRPLRERGPQEPRHVVCHP